MCWGRLHHALLSCTVQLAALIWLKSWAQDDVTSSRGALISRRRPCDFPRPQLLEQAPLPIGQALGDADLYAHVEVAAGAATELRQALAAQTQDPVGLRARIDLGRESPLKCGNLNIRPDPASTTSTVSIR